ncbi:MAG TPA: hypothetical protein VMT17_11105 [Anaeromyxobacteraceae bacterium]|nr:hypothetical protein [Anaeromyxobacteraceae bacterium]
MAALAPTEVTPGSAAELLAQGAAEYAKRPDEAAVRKADSLCLEAAAADDADVQGLICSIRAKAWLIEHTKDRGARTDLAVSAVQAGQWCRRRAPDSAACRYFLGVALGLQAREKYSSARDALDRMVKLLKEANAADPDLDSGGPARVLALFYARAPPWPGPGDADAALRWARKAVEQIPGYPPNELALAEALDKVGQQAESLAAYGRALELSEAARASGDPDAPAWVAQARAGLAK